MERLDAGAQFISILCSWPPCLSVLVQCLENWMSTQAGRAQEQKYLCPVCRSRSFAYLYNCNGDTFERKMFHPNPQQDRGTFLLSPAHKRRRGTYLQTTHVPLTHESGSLVSDRQTQSHKKDDRVRCPASLRRVPANKQLRTLEDPAVRPWILRELQALLLVEDPGLVLLVWHSSTGFV